ncbi:hypothetical protein L3X38_018614 [Prunus dulcis]|uniref:Uncharacterized protein n=1 Tax=Prunus dulcis TaxID=3755 RepID=A0AAD4WBL4_PRUDU|nr:hypothetical protein L3X38_018614 [Prunus dulcis]
MGTPKLSELGLEQSQDRSWTKSTVCEFADLAGVSVSPPSIGAVNCPHRYLKTSDVRPPNDHVNYQGDQPWHVPFPSPLLTPNHDPTSSGSEAESNDPLDKIPAVKHDLQYLSKETDWWKNKLIFMAK